MFLHNVRNEGSPCTKEKTTERKVNTGCSPGTVFKELLEMNCHYGAKAVKNRSGFLILNHKPRFECFEIFSCGQESINQFDTCDCFCTMPGIRWNENADSRGHHLGFS